MTNGTIERILTILVKWRNSCKPKFPW